MKLVLKDFVNLRVTFVFPCLPAGRFVVKMKSFNQTRKAIISLILRI
jgi:hypothetical protein